MKLALSEAKKGLFTTTANPRVGCVIVKAGKVISTGFHQRVGEPHAETFALKQAGEKTNGAIAYITLEPCSHFGKNPPCADALIKAGIKKVVVCNLDPNPLVAGKGITKLKAAGIKIKQGVKARKGLKLNRGFFHRMQTGLPFVTWKKDSTSFSKLNYLRACNNAILVDEKTLVINNWDFRVLPKELPKKYKKLPNDFNTNLSLLVVLDLELKVDLNTTRLKNLGRCVIMTSSNNLQKIRQLKETRVEVITVPELTNYKNLLPVFKWLGNQQINNLLVELNPHQ